MLLSKIVVEKSMQRYGVGHPAEFYPTVEKTKYYCQIQRSLIQLSRKRSRDDDTEELSTEFEGARCSRVSNQVPQSRSSEMFSRSLGIQELGERTVIPVSKDKKYGLDLTHKLKEYVAPICPSYELIHTAFQKSKIRPFYELPYIVT